MSGTYVNVTVASTDLEAIRRALQQVGRSAFVSGPLRGGVVVFDPQSAQFDFGPLAAALSTECGSPALAAVNMNGEILQLELWQGGTQVATYISNANAMNDADPEVEPEGDPVPFLAAFNPTGDLQALTAALRRDDDVFLEDLHEEIVGILGLPEIAAGVSWRHVQEDAELRAALRMTAITAA